MRELQTALIVLRLARGMKQADVADKAGLTKGMLSHYETGRQAPRMDTLSKLLGALAYSYADLEEVALFIAELKER